VQEELENRDIVLSERLLEGIDLSVPCRPDILGCQFVNPDDIDSQARSSVNP